MTIAKPTDLGRWSETTGDSGTPSGIVVPSSGKKDIGFAKGERPPRGYLNWLFNTAYEWFRWIDAITNPNGHSNEGVLAWYVTNQVVIGTDLTVGRDATLEGSVFIDGIQTVTLAGNTINDWALADHKNRVEATGNGIPYSDLTGMAGGVDGRVVVFICVGSNNILFEHQNSGSTAANRFILPGATQMTLNQDQIAVFMYDGGASRWRVISKNF